MRCKDNDGDRFPGEVHGRAWPVRRLIAFSGGCAAVPRTARSALIDGVGGAPIGLPGRHGWFPRASPEGPGDDLLDAHVRPLFAPPRSEITRPRIIICALP